MSRYVTPGVGSARLEPVPLSKKVQESHLCTLAGARPQRSQHYSNPDTPPSLGPRMLRSPAPAIDSRRTFGCVSAPVRFAAPGDKNRKANVAPRLLVNEQCPEGRVRTTRTLKALGKAKIEETVQKFRGQAWDNLVIPTSCICFMNQSNKSRKGESHGSPVLRHSCAYVRPTGKRFLWGVGPDPKQ